MKRTLKRLIACVAVVMMVFAMSTTVFAASVTDDTPNKIYHDGTAKYSYYTTDFVNQMSQNSLTCTGYGNPSNGYIYVRAYQKTSSGTYIIASDQATYAIGRVLDVDNYNDVRQIHVKFTNYGSSYGVSVRTLGTWTLYD